ncbi:phytanoyl-CoA dioxygenase family protein [Colwellia sp. RE-S-Sl-9]
MSDIATQFAENGFYHAKGLFNAAEVSVLEKDFEQIVTQLNNSNENIDATWNGTETRRIASKNDTILHTHNVQKYSRNWLDAFLHSKFLHVAEQILGNDIILHHSKLFQKPSENGSPFPMHQDWSYFPTVKDTMIAGIIHVSNATDEMGCLRVYPGSHKLGRIEGSNGRQPNKILDQYPIKNAQVIEAEPGDVVFFHYFTLHGSMPNRSNKVRKTVLCQLYNGADHVEPENNHPNERLVLQGWNHHISRDEAGYKL